MQSFLIPAGTNSGTSPDALRRQREIAEALLAQGMDSSPIQSPWQGIARLAEAFMGGRKLRMADKREAEGRRSGNELLSQVLFGGAGQLSPMAPVSPQGNAGAPPSNYADAIASIESKGSGDYSALGPTTGRGDRAYGRYQVMGANIPQWTQEALGRQMTPEEFLADPQAQDAVFNHKFGSYVQKYGNAEDAASAWFTGRPLSEGGSAQDQLGTSGNDYVNKFVAALGGSGSAPPAQQAIAQQLMAGGAQGAPQTPPQGMMGQALMGGGQQPMPPNVQQQAQQVGFGNLNAPPDAMQPGVQPAGGMGSREQIAAQLLGNQWIDPSLQEFALKRLFPDPGDPYTLDANDTRFDANNNPVAYGRPGTPDQPDAVQIFEYAKQNGYQGTFEQWQAEQRAQPEKPAESFHPLVTPEERARYGIPASDQRPFQVSDQTGQLSVVSGSGVNVSVGSEGGYDRTQGEAYGKRFQDIQTKAGDAQNALGTLTLMENAIAQPGFYSGIGGEGVLQLKRFGQVLGIDPEGISDMESFNALAKQAALANMGGSLGSGFSNADRDFVTNQVPGLQNTPEGNKRLVAITRSLRQREIEIGQLARDYAAQHDGRIDMGFDDALRQYAEAHPLFQDLQQRASPQGAPVAAPQVGEVQDGYRFKGGDPADPNSWEPVQ